MGDKDAIFVIIIRIILPIWQRLKNMRVHCPGEMTHTTWAIVVIFSSLAIETVQ